MAVATEPSIQYGTNDSLQNATLTGASWNGSNGGGTNSFYTLIDSSNRTPVDIILQFNANGTGTGSLSGTTYTITQNGNATSNSPVLSFASSTNGIDMQDKTLTFDFLASDQTSNANWNGSDGTNKRKMILNLTGTSQKDGRAVSLIGNLLIKAGMDINQDNTNSLVRPDYRNRINTNVFEATFGGDMIGNITIDVSDIKDNKVPLWNKTDQSAGNNYNTGNKASGFRDIQSTFTFQSGSLQGDIIGYTGVNTFTFNGNNVGITGNVSAHNGYTWSNWDVTAGSANQYYGAINKINFTGNGTATIGGNITSLEASRNIITFAGNTQGIISGNIISGYQKFETLNANQNNYIVFKGTSGTIGANDAKVNITIDNTNKTSSASQYNKSSNNTILFNASSSNSLYLTNLGIKGDPDYTGDTGRSTFNLLDFSGGSSLTNQATIESITNNRGTTIIGAGLVKDSATAGFTNLDDYSFYYNDNLFEVATTTFTGGNGGTQYKSIRLKSNALSEFAQDKYTAKGTYTIGDITIERGSSANYINVENLNITGTISTTYDDHANQNGGFGGKNYIFANGVSNISGNILSSMTNSATGLGNYNNLIILRGTSATLGNGSSTIKVKNNEGKNHGRYSNNTILLGATTNTIKLSELSATANWGLGSDKSKNLNIISINSGATTSNITTINSNYGNNIIGKNLVNSSGYNTALFTGANNATIQNNLASTFMSDTYTASGTYTFGSITASDGGNYINVENLTSTGAITANSGGSNCIYVSSGNGTTIASITASGTNTITLKGKANSINGNISNNAGTNTIDAGSNALTLGSSTSKITILTNGGANATTSITTTGVFTAYIDSITAGNHNNGAKTNTLTGGANSNLVINTMNATQNANSYNLISVGANSSILVTGNITSNTGKNNFTFTGDDSTLTLKGSSNAISTLTALSTATNGDTLIIDGSLNANNTTIDTLTNGDKLIVNFNGQGESKGATLNLKSTPTLKQVVVNDNSTNNTLDLSQTTTTTINTKIAIDNTQQLAINLSGTELALAKDIDNLGLKTTGSGISTINVSNTGTLSGGDIIATNLILNSSANATFKNANSTFATLTSTNGTLTLGEGSSAVTINSTDSTFNATFSGNSAQTLSINGGENTIATLTLNTQNNTLSIGGGSTTITNAITSNTGNNLTLQIGSSDSSKSATLNLSGAITTANTGSGTQGIANVIFTGSTSASSNLATLTLGASDNALTGVTTQTANALIEAGSNTSNLGTLTFSGTNGTQSLQINGGTNTITSLILSNANNILTQNAGNTTITNAISVNANQNLTLALTSSADRLNPSETSVTLNGAITKNSGVAKVTFTGGTDNQHYYSDLILTQANNTLSSVTSNAKNARITMKDTAGATIETTTIGSNSSLVFGFSGSGESIVTLSNGITVGSGSTLGVSIGGNGEKKLLAEGSANITFDTGSTLLIDFLSGSDAQVTLGDGQAIVIGANRKSIINFHGASTSTLNGSGITLDGGDNTINFLGSAEISSLTLTSGTNTINVYAPKSGAKTDKITATIVTDQVGSVSNTINLDDYAILNLKERSGADGSGTLTSSGLNNTLNFKGNEATFKGGFGATSATQGSATINVGSADKEIVSGTITGAVSNATLAFNAGKSILTLQSTNNTFKTINSQATDGVLVLDTSTTGGNGAVNATISGATTINTGKSLSFDFKGDQNSTIATTGGLVIDGTLGVIISGSGAKKVEGDINLNSKGTLYVNYAGGDATVTLGDGNGITIRKGESSIIDFNSTNGTLANALTLDGGSNTINFNQNAELDKITLTSGNNTFNVADGITATIGNTSAVGGVHNTINLGANSTINLKSGSGSGDGSGSIITSLNNTLNFNGSNATLKGSFGASGNGSARVNVAGSNSVITGSLSNASITFTSSNADLTLQGGNSTITSLTGFTAPSTYTRNGRVITRIISNTLTLDATANTTPVSATIQSAVVGNSVGLKFGDGSESKTFTFSASGNHLTGVAFGTTSTNNTLEFTKGNSTLDSVTLTSGSDLTIKLGDANLTLTGGYAKGSGTSANLSITGNAGIIANNQTINVDTLTFANNTSLSVSNSGANTFASVVSSNAGTLIANDSALTITALSGDNLTAGFSGSGTSSIAISGANGGGKTITLAGIVLNGATRNNTLNLSSLTSTTISSKVSVGANQSLAIDLGGTDATLTFSQGLSNNGSATINAGATTSNTIAGTSIALSNLNLNGADNTTTLTASNVTINTLNANATTSNKLVLDATNNSSGVSASINLIAQTTRGVGSLDIALISSGSNATTLSLNGNTLNSLDIQGDNNTLVGSARITSLTSANGGSLNIERGNVEVTNAITPTSTHNINLALNNGANLYAVAGLDSGSGSDQINLTLNNSTLSLGADSKITSLAGSGGSIDFVSSGANTSKTLTITGDCNANANVITYVDTTQSDKANLVTVSGTNSTGVLTISAVGNADEIFSITYEDGGSNNVKVAQIGDSGSDKATGGTSNLDGEIVQITLSSDGKGGYYIGGAISKGVDESIQEVVTSALAVNYDLYLANFNSLNKRMGELRNTQESNGVWARVFGGNMSNDFGVGSKTDYLTAQAGYDYSLSVGESARNFMGIALAYGSSSTKSNPSSNPNDGVLDNISSSMIEVGLYNSYVSDSGWYNDTILKFDYIMSDFTLKTGANSQQNSTNNFAFIVSDEFGYRYSFGESEKGSWYIDPQVEVALGYFNQSDFNQALNESATRMIKATQDSILTLRNRAGLSLGKKFNTDRGFASVYVGAFYEYDYIEGGSSDYALISSQGEVSNPLQSLESNGRAILNIGSNIELTKGARMYIDVEKSFGDKQRTFMQFNLGARYSF
ncbi:hypothetical protein [Helicobacter brantae]|uniref:Autotransporter domain-containing protein n=1 Tax=Helicobacter brantae TaxID=375927 RepID=A0A3D8IVS7_9HELI|nr:hypothetical protein [Helicobacter brantae]RDU69377.1 hypothetical protein CQA58_06880 [Helicobacter brantae]